MARTHELDLERLYKGVDFGDPRSAEGFRALVSYARGVSSSQRSDSRVSSGSLREQTNVTRQNTQEVPRVTEEIFKA